MVLYEVIRMFYFLKITAQEDQQSKKRDDEEQRKAIRKWTAKEVRNNLCETNIRKIQGKKRWK